MLGKYQLIDALVNGVAADGYAWVDGFLSEDEVVAVKNRLVTLKEEGEFKKAAIGRQHQLQVDKEVRGDYIRWVDPDNPVPEIEALFERIDHLRDTFNRTCFLGLKDYEAHYAVYPAGTVYQRHVDRFQTNPHRVISFVCYLNENWQEQQGGQLRIYSDRGEVDITPFGGRIACFRSELEHEVLAAIRPRYSFTGWMLDQVSGLTFL